MRASSFVHWTRESNPAAADEIQIHKCLENTHGLYRFGVGLYNRIQRHAPWAHHVYFNFLEVAAPCQSRRRLLGVDRFRAILDHVRPKVVLSTHGSLNHGFFDLAREHLGANAVRCVTYCGELFGKYGFSRHWVNPEADLFIGAVPETCAMARVLGMPAERTAMGGFLLNPNFYRRRLTAVGRGAYLRDRLGLDPQRFTLLLSTGEHGANNHLVLLEALRAAMPRTDLQVVALCGRVPADRQKVDAWARSHRDFPVVTLEHSTEMHLLLQCASAVMARPGTGTTSEAIVSGCPLIFNALGGFMPQEWITMRFAERHQIAETVHRAEALPPILARWAENPALLEEVRQRVSDCRPRAHPTRILRLVQDVAADLPTPSPGDEGGRPYEQLEEDPPWSVSPAL